MPLPLPSMYDFHRWAKRTECVVEWGNMVGPYVGQEFRETFATEEEATERERQALALESIGDKRNPVALERIVLHE